MRNKDSMKIKLGMNSEDSNKTPLSPNSATSSSSATLQKDSNNSEKEEIEWNLALEDLLCEEAEKCSGLSWLHGRCETYFSILNNRLQIPIIVLSTVVGAASVGSASLFPGSAGIASVSLGAISILVSILGMLNSHYAFGKRAEGHKLGCVQYAQIYRMVHIEMSLARKNRMSPKQLLRYIKEDLKRLMETLPRVPYHVIEEYKKEVIPTSEDVSHPDITNGVHKVIPFVEPPVIPSASCTPVPSISIRVLN